MKRPRLPEKLYRIGEIMEHTGLSRQTLHFYATMGLIEERRRTPSGYRLFPPQVFTDLERIRAMQKRGKTLREIRQFIQSRTATRRRSAKNQSTQIGTEASGPAPGRTESRGKE
jgi:DNA-binding transcriptional MerR regulator